MIERRFEKEGKPFEKDGLTDEERKEREQIVKEIQTAIDNQDADAAFEGRKRLRQHTAKVTIRILKDRLPKNLPKKEKEKFEEVMTNLSTLFENPSLIGNDGHLDIKKLRNPDEKSSLFDNNGKLKDSIKERLGLRNSTEYDSFEKNLNKALDETVSSLTASVEKIVPDFRKKLNKFLKNRNKKIEDLNNEPQLIEDFIKEQDTPENRKKYGENMAESIKKAIERGEFDPESARARTISWPDFIRLVLSLAGAFGIGGLAWLAINYALGHQGCMLYTCKKTDTFEVRVPTECVTKDDSNTFIKLLNPKAGITKFSSQQCTDTFPAGNKEENPDKLNSCKEDTCSDDDTRPYGPSCQPGTKFAPSGNVNECPHNYYRYDMFNPFAIIPDAIAAGANAVGGAGDGIWKFIKKIIFYVIIAFAIFIVLRIILMVVKAKTSKTNFGKLKY